MLTDLPRLSLNEIAPDAGDLVILCATPFLAQDLRTIHARRQQAVGASRWNALAVATPAQWLDHLVSAALLRDEIPLRSLPGAALTRAQELALWQRAIADDEQIAADGADALFDRASLARGAREADALQRRFKIGVAPAAATEEYRAFQRWSEAFARYCEAGDWRSESEVLHWRLECLGRGVSGLPARVALAGFTVVDPFLQRLVELLRQRGVAVLRLEAGESSAQVRVFACPDAAAECLAAAGWARDQRLASPESRLRIVVPDLSARRRQLEAALDAVLHPEALGCNAATMERDFSFVGGTPLAEESLVDVALRLLNLAVHPRRVAQSEFGALLRTPGWSADQDEADARALFERVLRERLPPEASLDRFQRQLGLCVEGNALPRLARDLDALRLPLKDQPRRLLPGRWSQLFEQCLTACGWPGQRAHDARERQVRSEFLATLRMLGRLDAVLGKLPVAEALTLLQRECRETRFAPARRSPPRVEVMGLDDAVLGGVDAVWVMGANEELWPATSQANGLLPVSAQRSAGVLAVSPGLQMAQSQEQRRLLVQAAPEVVFSWARQSTTRELAPSPLISEFESTEYAMPPAVLTEAPLEYLLDAKAPPVADGEVVRGGTWLIQAQSVCPAWSFYQYRLGAAVLPAPTFGLDARGRGLSLHGALEAFWRGRRQADVAGMSAEARQDAIRCAVNTALDILDADAAEPMPPRFRALEAERLIRLLLVWLEVEMRRPPFRVLACEEKHILEIEGLPVCVVIDRVDELEEDGRWVIIDYKSGLGASAESWSGTRITEPQLPIYASLVFPEQAVGAVALARVTLDGAGFVGIAEEDGLLPSVKGLEASRKLYAEADFPDWDTLRHVWADSVRTIAGEIRDGIAAVVVADEAQLAHCDVLPVLRLAERRTQWEQAR